MRVKTGTTRRKRHQKVLERTKGFRMTKGRLYKVSKEADLHAGQYAYVGRKQKKRTFRRLWIIRLNAFLKNHQYTYSGFIKALKDHQIELDRKVLAEMAVHHPEDLKQICQQVLDKK